MIKKIKTQANNYFKSNSVYEAISPLLEFGRLTSITPFKYRIESGKSKTVLQKITFLSSLIFVSFYLICAYFVMIKGDFFSESKESITKVFAFSKKVECYLGFFVLLCIIVMRYRKVKNWANNINYLKSIDTLFEKLGLRRDYKQLKKRILLLVLSQQVYCAIYMAFTIYTIIPFFDGITRIALSIVKYGTTFHIIGTRFIISSYTYLVFFNLHSLNEEISKIKNMKANFVKISKNGNILCIKRKCLIIKKLDLIWKTYSEICESSCVLEDSYCITTFAIMSWSFVSALLNTFYVMIFLVKLYDGNEMPWKMLLLALVQCWVNGFNLFSMIQVCDKCENEVIIKIYPSFCF